jgi:hypothetical protein
MPGCIAARTGEHARDEARQPEEARRVTDYSPARLRLGVNIDHVATIRNARGGDHPDPVRPKLVAVRAGGDGITAHLREDRRHIRDEDLARLQAALTAAAQPRNGGDRRDAGDRAAPRRTPPASYPSGARSAPPRAGSTRRRTTDAGADRQGAGRCGGARQPVHRAGCRARSTPQCGWARRWWSFTPALRASCRQAKRADELRRIADDGRARREERDRAACGPRADLR